MSDVLDHFLFHEPEGGLDRYEELLREDGELRHAEYDDPDPKRRRLKVSCNSCQAPWCCNQRVRVELVEALAIYRWAAENAPRELRTAVLRGKELRAQHQRAGEPLTESEFFRRRTPCPFLVKGHCSIYEVRPYQCRAHYMAGNPLKCRDELTPSETYEMSPDAKLLRELEQAAEDVRFHTLVEGMEPTELAETLYFIEQLAKLPRWKSERELTWSLVE